MKRPVLLVPRNAAKEMLAGPDTERMLSSGSWLVATKPKPRHKDAVAQESFRARRKAAGYRYIHVLLSPPVFDALYAARRGGETVAELIKRLVSQDTEKCKTETDN